jgi:hypothetical protein
LSRCPLFCPRISGRYGYKKTIPASTGAKPSRYIRSNSKERGIKMSFFQVQFWSYLIQPKVWLADNQLITRTSLLVQSYTLFSYCRVVCVDKSSQTLTIKKRFLWLFSKIRTIPFGRIRKIDYSYRYFPLQFDFWRGISERFERFIVSVVLVSPPETVKLFSFSGYEEEGLVFYFKGSQDSASRSYVDLLREYTGKELA